MKKLLVSLTASALGIASLVSGLAVDASMHAEDPTLAEREGIFSVSNPGHVLLGLGVLLATGGTLSALHIAWGMARPSGWLGKSYVRTLSTRASMLASVAAAVFALGVSASGDEHDHATEGSAAHAHDDGAAAAHVTLAPEDPDAHLRQVARADGDADEREPASVATGSAHQHEVSGGTAEQVACGDDLVRRTQEATARFADVDVALAEGYRSNPSKPNATHYGNRWYRLDGKVMDLEHPESLIYVTIPATGDKKLVGALFVMPRGEDGPQPCGSLTRWHTHAVCADLATSKIIPIEHGASCAEGYRYMESAQMMHVWFVPGRKNGVAPSS
jgi:hypothetical protein